MAEPVLRIENLSRSFGALTALRGVSLTVGRGEVFSVIGPNGAGKSTLFKVIAGLYAPSGGKVAFEGQDITGLAPEAINRRGLAKTFQITNVFPGVTVYDNVCIAAQSRSPESGRLASLWRRADIDAEVMELLAAVALGGRRDDEAQHLSHGEQRYLEMCLALATRPTLLLLDEPTAGMTPGETKEATALIQHLARTRGLTVLLIEHDMSVVMGISDRVAVLHFGEKIAEGPPDAIRADPRVIDAYLGGAED
jgi:branched-chain amino acid transport system ATP-binding protein